MANSRAHSLGCRCSGISRLCVSVSNGKQNGTPAVCLFRSWQNSAYTSCMSWSCEVYLVPRNMKASVAGCNTSFHSCKQPHDSAAAPSAETVSTLRPEELHGTPAPPSGTISPLQNTTSHYSLETPTRSFYSRISRHMEAACPLPGDL